MLHPGYTEMPPEFGGDTAYSDDFFVGRVGGVATYRNSSFFGLVDGLNFAVQYLGKPAVTLHAALTATWRSGGFMKLRIRRCRYRWCLWCS